MTGIHAEHNSFTVATFLPFFFIEHYINVNVLQNKILNQKSYIRERKYFDMTHSI